MFPQFQKDHLALQNAIFSLTALRLPEGQSPLLRVQMVAEHWLGDIYVYYLYDAEGFQAMMRGDRKTFLARQADSDSVQESMDENREKLKRVLAGLRENRPDQFTALGLSDHILIALDLENLIE